MDGATGYELVVYRVVKPEFGLAEMTRAMEVKIDGSALGWTPSADQGLSNGQYAWVVRAIMGEAAGDWSTPLFFSVESVETPSVSFEEFNRQVFIDAQVSGPEAEVAGSAGPVGDLEDPQTPGSAGIARLNTSLSLKPS